uniref:Peptidoglycan-recognition protein n=1 Tax=Reticulitermes speratus TaxID=60591 RepID=A0A1V1FYX0_9NEOP
MVSSLCVLLLLGNLFVIGNAACPTIISRSQWGARPPKGTPTKLPSPPVPYAVIHHGGSNAYCSTQTSCAAIVRSYQNHHIDTNGWNDIGYNFVVGEDGNVYEGRGWDNFGAHEPAYNSRSIGICIIGDFTARLPNQAALNAVRQLIQCGVEKNKIRSNYSLKGHRQGGSTSCPGNRLYQELTTWPRWTSGREK